MTMGNEIERREEPQTTVTTTGPDPTGGRLIAWAHAARAANELARALVQTSFAPLVGPKNNKRPISVGDATAMILSGDEVGLTPVQALRSIYLVHGTPALNARAMAALVLAHGHDFWVVEEGPNKVTVGGKRRGSEHEQFVTWTMDRARKAGYTRNEQYESKPQEMLYARAISELARRIAPDALAGMAYSTEELETDEAASTTTTVTRSSAKVSRAKAKPEPDEPPLDDTPQTPQGQESPGASTPVEGEGVGAPDDAPPAPEEPPLDEPVDAEVVDDKPATHTLDPSAKKVTQAQLRKIVVMMNEQGITEKPHVMSYLRTVTKTSYESRKDLTREHAHEVIEALTFDAEQAAADAAAASAAQGGE
jgi:hypothetical protein